jgi:aminoglycoside phosphotransferase
MSGAPFLLRELLPPGEAEWVPTPGGESGAAVFHDRAGKRYAKVVAPDHVEELAAERDRTDWLESTHVPSAVVLDWRASDVGACLITRAYQECLQTSSALVHFELPGPRSSRRSESFTPSPSGNAPSIGALLG